MSILPTAQQKKSDQTKQKLIDTAISLFQEYDVDTVTIDDICRSCDVTKGSFYHNFPSKDHIVALAVVISLDYHIEKNFILDTTTALENQLLDLLLCAFGFYRSIGKKMARSSYESLVRSCVDLHIPDRAFTNCIWELVRRGLAEGRFHTALDENNTYWLLISTYSGIIMKWSSQQDISDELIDWEQIIQSQIGLMLK